MRGRGFGAPDSPQQKKIAEMRAAIAARRYQDIETLVSQYESQFPDSGMGKFFTQLSELRQRTDAERSNVGSFILTQLGTKRKTAPTPSPEEAAAETRAAVLPDSSEEPTQIAMVAPGLQPTPSPEAPGTASPAPVETAAPAAAPPPAEEPYEPASTMQILLEKYGLYAGAGAGALILLAGITMVARRKKGKRDTDIFQEAMSETRQKMAKAGGDERLPDFSAGAAGGLFAESNTTDALNSLETGFDMDFSLPEAQTPAPAPASAPKAKSPEAPATGMDIPLDGLSFPELEGGFAEVEGAPTPTAAPFPDEDTGEGSGGGIDTDSGMLDLGLELSSPKPAAPAADVKPAPSSASDIDDLLSFIPAAGPEIVAPSIAAAAPEADTDKDSTGALNLDDLTSGSTSKASTAQDVSTSQIDLGDLDLGGIGGETRKTEPAPEISQTGDFDKQFEDIMFKEESDSGSDSSALDAIELDLGSLDDTQPPPMERAGTEEDDLQSFDLPEPDSEEVDHEAPTLIDGLPPLDLDSTEATEDLPPLSEDTGDGSKS